MDSHIIKSRISETYYTQVNILDEYFYYCSLIFAKEIKIEEIRIETIFSLSSILKYLFMGVSL